MKTARLLLHALPPRLWDTAKGADLRPQLLNIALGAAESAGCTDLKVVSRDRTDLCYAVDTANWKGAPVAMMVLWEPLIRALENYDRYKWTFQSAVFGWNVSWNGKVLPDANLLVKKTLQAALLAGAPGVSYQLSVQTTNDITVVKLDTAPDLAALRLIETAINRRLKTDGFLFKNGLSLGIRRG